MTPLRAVELVPVIELDPGQFATRERSLPAGSGRDAPGEWTRYWLDSLADSGVVGIRPLFPASWQVSIRQLTDSTTLARIIEAVVRDWGGPDSLTESDSKPVLSGGLALLNGGEVLVTPGCCGDLGSLNDWREAAAYRRPEWAMLWIGHPWLSVRFEAGQLVLSEPHESDAPVGRWSVKPDELDRAVTAAEAELASFAGRLCPVLGDMPVADRRVVARKLAGLTC